MKGHHMRGVTPAPFTQEALSRIGAASRARSVIKHPTRGRSKKDHLGIARAAKAKEGVGNPNFGKYGSNAPGWKGGRWSDKRGYVYILSTDHPHRPANNYMLEHILIAEKVLGRYLEHREVVHHINGDKADNRPENLWVCDQSTHRKAHLSAEKITMSLVNRGTIVFDRVKGEYVCLN